MKEQSLIRQTLPQISTALAAATENGGGEILQENRMTPTACIEWRFLSFLRALSRRAHGNTAAAPSNCTTFHASRFSGKVECLKIDRLTGG